MSLCVAPGSVKSCAFPVIELASVGEIEGVRIVDHRKDLTSSHIPVGVGRGNYACDARSLPSSRGVVSPTSRSQPQLSVASRRRIFTFSSRHRLCAIADWPRQSLGRELASADLDAWRRVSLSVTYCVRGRRITAASFACRDIGRSIGRSCPGERPSDDSYSTAPYVAGAVPPSHLTAIFPAPPIPVNGYSACGTVG